MSASRRLFNRLAGRRLAIVHDTPGVTRDRQEAEAQLGPLALRLIDTAGFESRARGQPDRAHDRPDQGRDRGGRRLPFRHRRARRRDGGRRDHRRRAAPLRQACRSRRQQMRKPRRATPGSAEAYALGFGEPVALSAEHGIGYGELLVSAPALHGKRRPKDMKGTDDEPGRQPAACGWPSSAGPMSASRACSTAFWAASARSPGPKPGITRDAVAAAWEIEGRAGARP